MRRILVKTRAPPVHPIPASTADAQHVLTLITRMGRPGPEGRCHGTTRSCLPWCGLAAGCGVVDLLRRWRQQRRPIRAAERPAVRRRLQRQREAHEDRRVRAAEPDTARCERRRHVVAGLPWPLISVHAVLLPDGRVMTYGSTPERPADRPCELRHLGQHRRARRRPPDAGQRDRHGHLLQLAGAAAAERQCLHRRRRRLDRHADHQRPEQQQQPVRQRQHVADPRHRT